MKNDIDKYYRTAEAAQLLKVNQRTVARWINNGTIKATKLNPMGENSPFIISQSEIDRFLELRKLGGQRDRPGLIERKSPTQSSSGLTHALYLAKVQEHSRTLKTE